MSERIAHNGTSVPPSQVWFGLTAECQADVIQFLARLASMVVIEEPVSTPRRSSDDHAVVCRIISIGWLRSTSTNLR
jgi:hypothetical protein